MTRAQPAGPLLLLFRPSYFCRLVFYDRNKR